MNDEIRNLVEAERELAQMQLAFEDFQAFLDQELELCRIENELETEEKAVLALLESNDPDTLRQAGELFKRFVKARFAS